MIRKITLSLILSLIFLKLISAGESAVADELPSGSHSRNQMDFPSPEAAVKTLVEAAKSKDRNALVRILGSGSEKLLFSGDDVEDNRAMQDFAVAGDSPIVEKNLDGSFRLTVGEEKWPFPIIKGANGWRFDTDAGIDEILTKRIGENELSVILTCRAYVLAQWEYFTGENLHQEGIAEYAQRFISSPGKRDGLYWKTGSGEKPSPLGSLVASARAEGYGPNRKGKHSPYHGYFFKILTRQGKHAPGGAYRYVINGHMIAGYALIAYPEKWGSSGIMTFIVNQQGRIYEKNFGPKSGETAAKISVYDPDPSWKLVRE